MKTHFLFSAELAQLRPMLDWIRGHLIQVGFDEKTIKRVELSSEEAIVNVIDHSYERGPGKIEIGFLIFPNSHIEIVIRDQGPPFNPLETTVLVDDMAPLEDREEGGLGIFLMRKYMDDVRYQREGQHNILTLVKKWPSRIQR